MAALVNYIFYDSKIHTTTISMIMKVWQKKRSRLSDLHSPFYDINHCSYFEYITDIKQNSFYNRGVDIYF